MSSKEVKDIVKYLFEAGQLKRVRRSGWWLIGVEHPESIAEHSFRAAIVGYMIGKLEGLNADRIALTILFHDMPEARINDLHKVGQKYINPKPGEKKAFKEQVEDLPAEIKKDILERIAYTNDDSTPEAVAAKDADLIECALQAREYIDKGFKQAQDWLDNIKTTVRTKTAKQMIAEINRSNSNSWWDGLKNIKR